MRRCQFFAVCLTFFWWSHWRGKSFLFGFRRMQTAKFNCDEAFPLGSLKDFLSVFSLEQTFFEMRWNAKMARNCHWLLGFLLKFFFGNFYWTCHVQSWHATNKGLMEEKKWMNCMKTIEKSIVDISMGNWRKKRRKKNLQIQKFCRAV